MHAVVNGADLVVPTHRVPSGLHVSVSTSHGQWNTSIKPVMADNGVRWEESLLIRGAPLNFPRWLMSIFPSSWKAVHLEIRASFETTMLGRGELVGRVETSLEDLLAYDGQFGESSPSLVLLSLTAAQKCHSRSLKLSAHYFC